MLPLVSIVTPVLNGARFLPQALDSVRRQAYPRVEHIVIDGGSTDGTVEILGRAPGVVSQFRRHPRSLSATLGLRARLSEMRRVCGKRRTSFALTLWYEALYVPLRRRIGLRP